MAAYSIFVRAADPAPLAIADRFSWFATLLPPVYMAAHGLWLTFAGLLVVLAAIGGLTALLGGATGFWLYVLAALWFGFEAPMIRRAEARRAGYAPAGERIALSAELAERDWLGSLSSR